MYGIYGIIGGILMVNVTIYTIHGSYGYVHIYFIPFLGKPISHNLALSLRFTNCCKFIHPTNASSWSFAGSLGMKDMSSLAISLKTNPKSCHLDICRIQKTAVSAQTCCTSHHNRHLNSLSLSTTRHQAWTRRSDHRKPYLKATLVLWRPPPFGSWMVVIPPQVTKPKDIYIYIDLHSQHLRPGVDDES